MNPDIREQRKLVEDLRRRLEIAKDTLDLAIRSCQHEWSAVTPDHIYHEGYLSPGDPPGTMGVDRRLPFYVEPHTEKRWKRTCKKCGEVEYTSNVKTQTQIIEHPDFGS